MRGRVIVAGEVGVGVFRRRPHFFSGPRAAPRMPKDADATPVAATMDDLLSGVTPKNGPATAEKKKKAAEPLRPLGFVVPTVLAGAHFAWLLYVWETIKDKPEPFHGMPPTTPALFSVFYLALLYFGPKLMAGREAWNLTESASSKRPPLVASRRAPLEPTGGSLRKRRG